MDQIALVRRQRQIIGWIGFDMLDADKTICECADPISPDAILASNTPIIEALPALTDERYPFLFVLEKNSLAEWISFSHLYKLPFRLCLFSLLLGVEQLCSELLKMDASEALSALRPKRIDGARAVYAKRGLRLNGHGKEYQTLLLDCTTFADKLGMVQSVFGASVPASKSPYFIRAEQVRNELAHTHEESDLAKQLKKDVLMPLIQWAETIQAESSVAILSLADQTPNLVANSL